MTQRDRKTLGEYVRAVADQLWLRDWKFHLMHEPCEEGKAGNVVCVEGQREANISLARHFSELDPEEQRETIIHELVHCHLEACWRMVQGDLDEPLGKVGYYVFCDAYRRNMELAVDALAKALAPHFPLISWPAKRRR